MTHPTVRARCPCCFKFDRVCRTWYCKRCDVQFTEPVAPQKSTQMPEPLDSATIQAALRRLPPSSYSEWQFEDGRPTFIQTDSASPHEARWYLTKAGNDDPDRWMEVPADPQGLLWVISHLTQKTWVDDAQLLEALLPAIRTLARKRNG